MDINKFLPALLVVLLLVSAVQAVQLNSLKEKVAGVEVGSAPKTTTAASSPSGQAPIINQINDLPQMVGGC